MTARNVVIAALLTAFATPVWSAESSVFSFQSFIRGNDYRKLPETQQHGYGMGVIDGIDFAAGMVNSGGDLEWLRQCRERKSSDQVEAIIEKEMRNHPGKWDSFMSVIVYEAFLHECGNSPYNKRSTR